MERSDTIGALASALSAAQSEMPAAPMQAENPFLHNRYADLGSVISTAKPILAQHGLSVSQIVTGEGGAIGIETILMHESGEFIASTAVLPLGEERGKSLAQLAGANITYLRRYAYAAILGMYADEDTDGNVPSQKPESGNKTTQRPTTQPQPNNGGQGSTQARPANNPPASPTAGAPSNGRLELTPEEVVALVDAKLPSKGIVAEQLTYCRRELLRTGQRTWASDVRAKNLDAMLKLLEHRGGMDRPLAVALCCAIVNVTWGKSFHSDEVLEQMPVSVIAMLTAEVPRYKVLAQAAQQILDAWVTA